MKECFEVLIAIGGAVYTVFQVIILIVLVLLAILGGSVNIRINGLKAFFDAFR